MKILKETRVKSYELTYLLPASFSVKEVEDAMAQVDALIKKHKGKVTSTDSWGKKYLAYKIKAEKTIYTEAVYTHQVIDFPVTKTQDFEKELHLKPEVIRHLLVVA